MTIAEESTAYPKVTSDVDDPEGLGFVYKWNMGYMHDTLYYMELDPLYRKDNHGAIIFSMDYAYSENYILPYSHHIGLPHIRQDTVSEMAQHL